MQRRLKRYEDRLIQEAYLNRAIKDAETEDRLKARYQTFAKDKAGHEEVHARHILVKTEAEANSIVAELDKEADFAELAKKHSTDPGANRAAISAISAMTIWLRSSPTLPLPCPPANTPRRGEDRVRLACHQGRRPSRQHPAEL